MIAVRASIRAWRDATSEERVATFPESELTPSASVFTAVPKLSIQEPEAKAGSIFARDFFTMNENRSRGSVLSITEPELVFVNAAYSASFTPS